MNEFRQDISSGDWIILAPGRAARPQFLDKKKKAREPSPIDACPFEDLQKSGNWPAILSYPTPENWRIVLIPNKYPALTRTQGCAVPIMHGIYKAKTGVGQHELIITKDHYKNFGELDPEEAFEVLKMLQTRYRMAAADPCNAYASSFFNWGSEAGASIWHPHYQILVLPIIPPHVVHSLHGSEAYYKKYGRCVRCDVIINEKKEGLRIIEENADALAYAPYASKSPFEVRILPKIHAPHFSRTPEAVIRSMSELLQSSMQRIKKYVNDPDLNVFIHGAPFGPDAYEHHHWHIEIFPKISTMAGFELSTGIDINVVDPDMAAAILRGENTKE